MGYLICDKCGGYYELQPGEKPEDFSNECECGGKLIYSDTFDVSEETEDVYTGNDGAGGIGNEDVYAEQINDVNTEDGNITDGSSPLGEELITDNKSKTTEDYKASLMDKAYVKQIKLATQVQEILETKGYYIIKGTGNHKFIKILKEGIETDDGQLIRFEDIINVEDVPDGNTKPKDSSEKSGLGTLISTGHQIFAPRKVTLNIIHTKGEIELKNAKSSDAKRVVSFLKRRLNK